MSQYWRFGPFSNFSYAPRLEVFKMLFLCFEPEPLLLKGPKGSGYFSANPKAHLPWESDIQFLQ